MSELKPIILINKIKKYKLNINDEVCFKFFDLFKNFLFINSSSLFGDWILFENFLEEFLSDGIEVGYLKIFGDEIGLFDNLVKCVILFIFFNFKIYSNI